MSVHPLWRHTFTLSYPPDREDECDIDGVRSALNDFADKWIFQLERGSEAGKLHLQGRLQLQGKKKRCTTVVNDLARILGIEKSWITVRPEADEAGSFRYCLKEDTRVDGPWADKPIYLGKDLCCMAKPHPWQSQVLRWLTKSADDRSINWIFDPIGAHGKSKLAKWLRKKNLAKRIPLGNASQIKTSVISMGASPAYVIDLPRVRGADETREALFSAIEDVKNGWVQSAMYGKFSELMFEPPHVIVFSNELPEYSFASADRWKVWGFDEITKPLKTLARPVVVTT